MTARTKRTDARRAAILEAARRLLIRRGYQDIVLDDLAREAGVAKGTLFLYFKTKGELLTATFAELVDRLGDELEALGGARAEGAGLVELVIRTILAQLDRNSDFLSHFGPGRFPGCGGRSCERLMPRLRRNMRLTEALLRRAEKGLGFRIADPRAAGALFGLCRSALIYQRLQGRTGPIEHRARWVLEQFLYGARGRAR